LIEDNELNAFLSESVLSTADYILQKTATRTIRLSMLSHLLGFLPILSCTTKICQQAIESNPGDLEDAILYQVALEGKVDYFITNDINALKKLSSPDLPVVSTKEFLTINK
jgi:predicted nucleic acid-binding protein